MAQGILGLYIMCMGVSRFRNFTGCGSHSSCWGGEAAGWLVVFLREV